MQIGMGITICKLFTHCKKIQETSDNNTVPIIIGLFVPLQDLFVTPVSGLPAAIKN